MLRKYFTIGIIASIVLIAFITGCVEKPAPVIDDEGTTIVRTVGETESTFLIQKINTDSVDGLWFQAYPVPREEGTPRTLKIGDDIGYACEGISEILTAIDYAGQKVTFKKTISDKNSGACPICLSGDTLIDTPDGELNIRDLKVGMRAWTIDTSGKKQPAVIFRTRKTLVPNDHKMVHIVLDDEREIFGSRGHPTIDGRIFGDLKKGDALDGSFVKSVELVVYNERYTYDILLSGDTGFYWANGILVGSTLK